MNHRLRVGVYRRLPQAVSGLLRRERTLHAGVVYGPGRVPLFLAELGPPHGRGLRHHDFAARGCAGDHDAGFRLALRLFHVLDQLFESLLHGLRETLHRLLE